MILRDGEDKDLTLCNATNEQDLAVLGDIKFDIIIDDASHNIADQLASVQILWKKVRNGGLYIIEDIQVQAYGTILDLQSWNYIKIFQKIPNMPKCNIIDRRKIKNRYDDILVIWKKE